MYGGRKGPVVFTVSMVGGRVLLYLQYVWREVGSCCTCNMTMAGGRVLLYLQYDYGGR